MKLIFNGRFYGNDLPYDSIILKLYEEHGDDFPQHLPDGDFAFALVDDDLDTTYLCRDRVGNRVIYYTIDDGIMYFNFRILDLLESCNKEIQINKDKIKEYITNLAVYGEETLFYDVYEVQPAEIVIYRNGKINKRKYFDFEFDSKIRDMNRSEQIKGFLKLFDNAIKKRFNTDTKVLVSGGIDSTFLVSRLRGFHTGLLQSYSLGINYQNRARYNEFKYSDQVSKLFYLEHNNLEYDVEDFSNVCELTTEIHEEPMPHVAAIPAIYLCNELENNVILSGGGGDELFGGYSDHIIAANNFNEDDKDVNIVSKLRRIPECVVNHIINQDSNDTYRHNMIEYFNNNNYPDSVSKMLYMELKTHAIHMLNKESKINNIFNVDCRFPFLDYELIQFVLSMSPNLKINNGVGKYLLKNFCHLNFWDISIHYLIIFDKLLIML